MLTGRGGRRFTAAIALLAVACAGTLTEGAAPASADTIRSGQQWVLDMLNVPAAWQATQGRGVTVAVLDSGVNPAVSDLTGSVITGPDLTGISTSPANANWGAHGTWMASLIAGHGHTGGSSGVAGIAPQAKVLSIRVIPDHNDPGYGSYEREQESRIQRSLATGIRDAVNDGADVISMSIGYSVQSATVREALQYAYSRGVVVVASSGNSGDSNSLRAHAYAPTSFPADYPGVIGVAAVNSSGTVANFSSDNLSVQVAAPGVYVPAQGRDGAYWLVSGTSPACALVAGVVALIKSEYPKLSPALVASALTATTGDRPQNGYDSQVGFGTVNAAAALAVAGRLDHERPRTTGVAATAKFGHGDAAVAPFPVTPRGSAQLVLFALLAFASLLLIAAAGGRLAWQRRRALRPALGPPPEPAPIPWRDDGFAENSKSPQPWSHGTTANGSASLNGSGSSNSAAPAASEGDASAPSDGFASWFTPAPEAPLDAHPSPAPRPQGPFSRGDGD
jgi:type VII secretion-associated serine protease mycosin